MAIHATAPSSSLLPQSSSISDPASAQALPRKQTDGDLGLVQPTAVLGRVVHRESIPQPGSRLLPKASDHCLAGVRTQIVQPQMDGIGLGIADRNFQQVVSQFGRRTVRRHLGKILPSLRFHSAEHVGRATTLVLAIASRHSSGPHRLRTANVLVQNHRFLIHTNHWLLLASRLLIHRQNVLPALDILLLQFRHAPHFFPATALGRGFPAGRG